MSTTYTKLFTEISHKDKSLVGGKGLSLGLLINSGISVPMGFVVTSEAYQLYLEYNNIKTLNLEAQQKILNGQFPENIYLEIEEQLKKLSGQYFAVRSSSMSEDSSEKSFAGMFESYLNIQLNQIVESIKKCYVSTLSERVLHYRDQEEPIAVVIQRMVNAQASGVLFTNHPLMTDQDVIVIESCSGLGEPLVSGIITPDLYIVDKQTGTILEKQKHRQQIKTIQHNGENKTVPLDGTELKINPHHIRQLVAVANDIENFFNFPCDIEWCIDENEIVQVVQSRPITTKLKHEQISQQTYYKRFFSRILSPIFEEANVKGYWKYRQNQFELPFSLTGYHVYQPSVLHPKGEVDIWINTALDKKLTQFIKKMLRRDIHYFFRIEHRYLELVEKFTTFALTIEQENFQTQISSQLIDKIRYFDDLNQQMTSIYNAPIFILSALGDILLEEMRAVDPQKADSDFLVITLNCIQNPVWQRSLDLNKIHLTAYVKYGYQTWSNDILKNNEIKGLLNQYQHRWKFLNCTDVMGEAYNFEDCAQFLKQQFEKNPHQTFLEIETQTQQEFQEFNKVAQKYKNLSYEIALMRKWLYHRNNTTEHYYRDFQYLKLLWLNISQQLGISYRNLLNLSITEIIQGLTNFDTVKTLQTIANDRNTEGFSCFQQGEQIILKTGINDNDRLEKEILGNDTLQGQIANTGCVVEGIVKIIRDPIKEADRFNENDILVTGMTTPSFLLLMEKSSGIITDEGGILCHAALVSREIGKPCLIAVANATQILKDNDKVLLNCNDGFVKIIEKHN
jgi:phosphoenolpyruvate synthase/pyruvate phosphate dikinase